MAGTVRGIAGALLFGKALMDGKSVEQARAETRETMGELAPLIDPAIEALDDVARKRALRRSKETDAPPVVDNDGVTVIETTGEEVIEPPRKRS